MAERIGIIGLGLAGSAMARRFTASGLRVSGYDISPAAREAAARAVSTC